jgi:hypothetical protein
MTAATQDSLRLILGRYEAALQEAVNEGGDETEAELELARKDLLDILRQAKVNLPSSPAPPAVPNADTNPEEDQQGPADSQP